LREYATLGIAPQAGPRAEIQASICDYLDPRKHFWWRNNSAAFKTERGGFVRFGTPGSPDVIVVHVGRPYFLEVKRDGFYQSPKSIEAHATDGDSLTVPSVNFRNTYQPFLLALQLLSSKPGAVRSS